MANRSVPDLKELFKQASESAQQVPENMQEAAFNRALDLLTGNAQSDPSTKIISKKSEGKKKNSTRIERNTKGSLTDELLSTIDSTRHPGVRSANKILDSSLMVLQIALVDHKIDGLTASQIAKILIGKFRISTSVPAVRMALMRATNLVNRIPDRQSFLYKIMAPGEEYLAHLSKTGGSGVISTPQRKKGKKRVAKKSSSSTSKKSKAKKQRKGKGGRPGPGAIVKQLMGKGFFKKTKTIQDVIDHCDSEFAYKYKASEFSVALMRALRNKVLGRQKNAEGQFEYFDNPDS